MKPLLIIGPPAIGKTTIIQYLKKHIPTVFSLDLDVIGFHDNTKKHWFISPTAVAELGTYGSEHNKRVIFTTCGNTLEEIVEHWPFDVVALTVTMPEELIKRCDIRIAEGKNTWKYDNLAHAKQTIDWIGRIITKYKLPFVDVATLTVKQTVEAIVAETITKRRLMNSLEVKK